MSEVETEFRDFAEARSTALLRTAYLITGDHHHAEDLVQTALARVFVAWPRIRDKGAVEAYARRTMVTTYVSWRRRRWWQERPTADPPEPRAATDGWSGPDHEDLWQTLATLSRQQRAVVVLRFVEDRSVEEVAGLLGITGGSVKTHTSRALAALRIRLDEAGRLGSADGGARR